MVGNAGSHCTVGGRPLGTHRETEYLFMKELGFQILDRGDESLLQTGVVGMLDLCALWGNRVSGDAHRVAIYSFPPLSEESGILAL
jgi:hypothetical protein